jgi:hypothetical protein
MPESSAHESNSSAIELGATAARRTFPRLVLSIHGATHLPTRIPLSVNRLRFLRSLAAVVAAAVAFGGPSLASAQTMGSGQPANLPERLSDTEFWKLVTDISEPGGYFRMADNFTSNETRIGAGVVSVRSAGLTGGVYVGVGPEQNLTYIATIRPKMAFIVDIRRQAVMQHLMYKAMFELSQDRADFISILFSRPRPAGLTAQTLVTQLWAAFQSVAVDTGLVTRNRARVLDHLTKTHGFTFTPDETTALVHVFDAFTMYGPGITTNGRPSMGNGFSAMTSAVDQNEYVSFLATEELFGVVKDLHQRNLIVPTSGNFGGPKAIRAIGAWLHARNATVTAFYVSNVEQYLFMDGISREFYGNVGTLPVNDRSVFIRLQTDFGGAAGALSLCPIAVFLRAAAAGRVLTWADAQRCPV